MKEVTIAIPVYNAEKYIKETILSALNQTFENLEILIIDDKGTDKSISIIEELQKKHPRGNILRIIPHEKNLGVAAARNTILREANSAYLYFLDSDDIITPDCIQLLYQNIKNEDADLAYASYEEIWENTGKKTNKIHPYQLISGENEFGAFVYRDIYHSFRSFVWNILYKLSFLRAYNFSFESVKVWEDLLFTTDMIPYVRKAVLLPDITYTYYRREGSLSQYNPRNTIPANEILEHIHIRTIYKEKCFQYKNKPYFDKSITKALKICLDTASVIVEKRKVIYPSIPITKIKELILHPLTYKDILKMKQNRTVNLSFYSMGKMPAIMLLPIIKIYTSILKRHRNKGQ